MHVVSILFFMIFVINWTHGNECPKSGVIDEALQLPKISGCCGLSSSEISSLRKSLKELTAVAKDVRRKLNGCVHRNTTNNGHAKKNADSSQSRKGKEISNEIAAGFTPPPEEILHSENCPRGFEEVGKNCYKVYLSPRQWETFGDASEICKSNSGSALATPENQEELRQFLIKKNYAKRFWVGAKKVKKSGWKWLDGRDVDDWAPRNPTRNGSKRCIYWRPPNYKAVNHYCGEKFPFVCQKPI